MKRNERKKPNQTPNHKQHKSKQRKQTNKTNKTMKKQKKTNKHEYKYKHNTQNKQTSK